MIKEASYYIKKSNGDVACQLCNHKCIIKNEKSGICNSRFNQSGELLSLNYGRVVVHNVETLEKKPIYHFYPGKSILSLGTCFCNFKCGFCINWEISQFPVGHSEIMPNEVISMAYQTPNCLGVSFSYNEPTIWYEYVYDTSKLLHENNFKSIIVSNGGMQTEPLKNLCEVTDAYLFNLKSFSNTTLKSYAGKITKESIIKNIELVYNLKKHVEVTYLVIPDFSDNLGEIKLFIKAIANISENIPVHFLKFHPAFNFRNEPTSIDILRNIKSLAKDYLTYVYVDNTSDIIESDTLCKKCGEVLITREGYISTAVNLESLSSNVCLKCNTVNDIII